jgi:hypothetical protein
MKRCSLPCFVVGCLLVLARFSHAQDERPTQVQINLDMRSRLASEGASHSALYSSGVVLKSRLAPGLEFTYDGGQSNARILTGNGGRFNRFITQEAVIDREWGANHLQMGIVRLPFGLYNNEETYASGLIDYPLARVDYALNAVNWGAPGVRWSGGTPTFQVEAAGFGGQGAGVWGNLNNVAGGTVRMQTYFKGIILGVSRWDGTQSANLTPGEAGAQPTHFSGVDLRLTRPHLLLRGEYLFGVLGNEQMHGWYLDAYYHLPKYYRWTLVSRVEGFQAESNVATTKQLTLGFRYTLDRNWIFAFNVRKNTGIPYRPTWTPSTLQGADVFFQVYRKLSF